MKKVDSSHIDSVGYDDAKRILTIKFSNGAIYSYSNVPQYIHMCLMLAASQGQYFDQHIKGNKAYPAKKVQS